MTTFAEINNSTNDILRTLTEEDNWVAPPQKFGPDKPTRFVRVVNETAPEFDPYVFKATQSLTLEGDTLTKSVVVERHPEEVVMKNVDENILAKIGGLQGIVFLARMANTPVKVKADADKLTAIMSLFEAGETLKADAGTITEINAALPAVVVAVDPLNP